MEDNILGVRRQNKEGTNYRNSSGKARQQTNSFRLNHSTVCQRGKFATLNLLNPMAEFPHIGAHCSVPECRMLDFLPMKCDACSSVLCRQHIQYDEHRCESAHRKNVQVPVCPLCDKPVPTGKNELPDMKVGEHIDRDCKSDPAQKNRLKVGQCSMIVCKKRETPDERKVRSFDNSFLVKAKARDHPKDYFLLSPELKVHYKMDCPTFACGWNSPEEIARITSDPRYNPNFRRNIFPDNPFVKYRNT
ncbi:AN1-like zinc finger domain-containing protein [Ditylenchus destructor]|nr:AN1-like zinc finger domain-containing protein [Ditylenchus destructor]